MSRVYRTEKNDNYTVMCNHHLNKELSLKAKGLLSQMLSFPNGWNFKLKGLATLNKDGVDSIRATMNELEKAGYVTRNRSRNEKGQLLGTEYTVREIPQIQPELEKPEGEKATLEKPMLENPILDSPVLEKPMPDNPTLLNTKESSIEQLNTNLLNIHPSIIASQADSIDENDRDLIKSIFKKNIDYETLSYDYNREVVGEILELMVDTYCSTGKTIRINKNEVPVNVVKGQLMKLDMFHIQYVMQCMKNNTTKIGNIRSYLLTALYNAPFTKSNFYQAETNAKEEVGKPFPKEEELNQKLERLSELNALLNMDEREDTGTEQSESKEKEERPERGSIHEKLQIYKEKSQRESETGKENRKRDFGLE